MPTMENVMLLGLAVLVIAGITYGAVDIIEYMQRALGEMLSKKV